MGLGFTRVLDQPETGNSRNYWRKARYEDVPRDALLAGTFQGKEQFIGKYISSVQGFSFVGPVFRDKGLATVYSKSNKFFHSYEIFLNNENVGWKTFTRNTIPEGAIPSVETIHGFGYVGKHAEYGVGMVVCKENKWTFVSSGSTIENDFQILCELGKPSVNVNDSDM